MLQSQDEQNVILVTYKDLKKALSKVSLLSCLGPTLAPF